ncbi:Rib/alpha-like domain-containing protein, partial [Ligilactobacillus apodemi]
APESVLDSSVAFPQGTKVTWKVPVDTSKAGMQTGTLEVTYPDGSKDDLPVQVKVGTDADAVTPKVKANVHAALNSKLTPESVLDPNVALPQGTKVAWKTPVDTSKAGMQTGTLEVTYPDGSKDELPVTVTVDGGTKKNTKMHAAALNANQKDHSNNNNDQGTNLKQKHEKATKNVVNNQTQVVLKGNQKELSFKQTGQNDSSLEREPEKGAKHVANNHKQVALAKMRSQSTKQALTKATKTSTELPQTGEKNSASLTLLGLVGALLGLFGLTEATKGKSKKF